MCFASKPPSLPPPPAPPVETPVAPMQSPEDSSDKDTTGKLRKSKGRRGLRIDMAPETTSGGLNIPL